MSDKRRVARDKRRVEDDSMSAVLEARHYLEALTIAQHRGPTDTWTAARDRAAKQIGLERSYAARIWNRWQSMKDVSGAAYRALQLAYEAQCERNETAAAHTRRLREELAHAAADEVRGEPRLAGHHAAHRAVDGAPGEAAARAVR
jgi:hypothetical protein